MPLQRNFRRNFCMIVIIDFTTDAVTTISQFFTQLHTKNYMCFFNTDMVEQAKSLFQDYSV